MVLAVVMLVAQAPQQTVMVVAAAATPQTLLAVLGMVRVFPAAAVHLTDKQRVMAAVALVQEQQVSQVPLPEVLQRAVTVERVLLLRSQVLQ
jgi:hypothetical protein